MIDMCVGQEYSFDRPRRHGQRDVFEDVGPLFHAAVDQILPAPHFQQGTGACDLMGRTDELNFHGITSGIDGDFPSLIL